MSMEDNNTVNNFVNVQIFIMNNITRSLKENETENVLVKFSTEKNSGNT